VLAPGARPNAPVSAGEPVAGSGEAPASEPATVTVDVEGGPAGVTVTVDGQPSRVPIVLPRGDGTHALVFSAPGFASQQLKVDARRSRVVTLAMLPEAAAAPSAAAPPDEAVPVAAPATTPTKNEKRGAAIRERKKKEAARPEAGESFHRFDDL